MRMGKSKGLVVVEMISWCVSITLWTESGSMEGVLAHSRVDLTLGMGSLVARAAAAGDFVVTAHLAPRTTAAMGNQVCIEV